MCARLALDSMAIPASRCDCERMFSELSDLLEPKRRVIGSTATCDIGECEYDLLGV
jgi:hypothetical protein